MNDLTVVSQVIKAFFYFCALLLAGLGIRGICTTTRSLERGARKACKKRGISFEKSAELYDDPQLSFRKAVLRYRIVGAWLIVSSICCVFAPSIVDHLVPR
jgi:hypothetical protein